MRDWRERRDELISFGLSIWSVWSIWFIRLVWFNQTNETDQINQTVPLSGLQMADFFGILL